MHSDLAVVVTWATLTGGIWAFTEMAARAVSDQGRRLLSRMLKTGYFEIPFILASTPQSVSLLFDAVFGVRHFSVRCFVRSAAASVIALLIVLGLFWASLPDYASMSLKISSASDVLGLGLAAAVINVLPDYLSLWKTRFILRSVERRQTMTTALVKLAVDCAVTAVAPLVVMVLTINVINLLEPSSESLDIQKIAGIVARPWVAHEVAIEGGGFLFFFDADELAAVGFAPFVYTSLWPLLFTASIVFAVALARPVRLLVDQITFVGAIIDFDKNPVEVIGASLAIVVTMLTVCYLILRHL